MQGHMAATSTTPANTSAPQSETERTRPTLRSPFIAHSLVPAVTVHLDVRPIPEGSNDIQCFQCGGTVQQSRLAAHLRSRHPALSLSGPMMAQFGLTPCPQCRQLFSASRGLAAHLRTCGRGPVDEGMIFLTPDAQHVPAPHLAATQVIHHGVLSEAPVMGAAPARRTSGHVSRSLSTHADPSAPQDLFSDFPAVGRSSSEVLLADLHQDGCDREVAEEHRHPGQEPCNDCDAPRDDSQLHQVLTQIIRHEGDLETEPTSLRGKLARISLRASSSNSSCATSCCRSFTNHALDFSSRHHFSPSTALISLFAVFHCPGTVHELR